MSFQAKIVTLLRSRRFWVALSAGLVAFAREMDVQLEEQTVEQLILIAATWILGDSLSKTGIESHAQRAVADGCHCQ